MNINTEFIRDLDNNTMMDKYRGGPAGHYPQWGRIVSLAEKAGISWPATTTKTLTKAEKALTQVHELSFTRPRLTWKDATAPDMKQRVIDAIQHDFIQNTSAQVAKRELSAAITGEVTRALAAAIPDMLEHVCTYLEENADMADAGPISDDVPARYRGDIDTFQAARALHAALLERSDPMTYMDTEINSDAHILYDWTKDQWLTFHTEHDTLNRSRPADWATYARKLGVTVKPARTATELAQRTIRHNDTAADYNRKHRRNKI